MSVTDSCILFNELAVPLLEGEGISTEDPDQAGIEAAYEECLERKRQAATDTGELERFEAQLAAEREA